MGGDATMKLIPLSQGKHAMVDDTDYAALSQFKWYADRKSPCLWYAVRNIQTENGRTCICMHNVILGKWVDHRDGDGLNNQRKNLRPANQTQNRFNSRKTHGTSKFKGVYWYHGKWTATSSENNKTVYLGRFETELEASQAYRQFVISRGYGEFLKPL